MTEPGGAAPAPRLPRVGVAVPAAGVGRRMGGVRKPWLEIAGEPVLIHALRPFLGDVRVVAVCVALSPDDAADPPGWLIALDPRLTVVAGGAERADSVARAVEALPDDLDVILVHDAARPLTTPAMVDRVVAVAARGRVAVAGWPATDTMKTVDADRRVVATPDRRALWHAQTPQGFPARLLREALAGREPRASATDDASLLEGLGAEVEMVEGGRWNLKVTHPDDVPVAEFLLGRAVEAAP